MKELIFTVVLAFVKIAVIAQIGQEIRLNNIPKIFLSTTKTSTLTFPEPITFVDKGTDDILVSKVPVANNILLVKARIRNFKETNITVITNDGGLFSSVVKYDSAPKVFSYTLKNDILNRPDLFNSGSLFPSTIADYAKIAAADRSSISGIKDKKLKMKAKVNGIYIKDDVLFFRIAFANKSALNYDFDLLRLFITNRAKTKRTPVQEQDQEPLLMYGNIKQIKAKQKSVVVIALPRFNISNEEFLSIQIIEKNGRRDLKLKVRSDRLIKAKALIK